MQLNFAQSRLHIPASVLRGLFILLCLVVSAALAMLVGQGPISIELFGASLVIVLLVSAVVRILQNRPAYRRWLVPLSVAGLVGILIFSRYTRLQLMIFGTTVGARGEWIGISYLIFRLIHVVVDSKALSGGISSGDLAAYALFPPALVAGPIHRYQSFAAQLDKPHYPATQRDLADCLWRISIGAVKKLLLANFLSNYALDANIVANPWLPRWFLWLSLICYSFMLYLDFSGYSDIAIGVAGLVGIRLPENFANPYAQPNLTRFWQSWHISLSTWLRDYIFFPVSRFLLGRFGRRFATPIMAAAHLITMGLAGLWHGFTAGFFVWGLWHGAGLFAHAQWERFVKQRGGKGLPRWPAVALTFIFVSLGWAFFALPDLSSSLHFLMRLVTG